MIKYASNAFRAVKNLSEMKLLFFLKKLDQMLRRLQGQWVWGTENFTKILHCGPGYGGSCFPKYTKAIIDIGKKYGEDMMVIKAAVLANEKQKRKTVEKIISKRENELKEKLLEVLRLSHLSHT